MKEIKSVKNCRVCNSNNVKLVLSLEKTPIGENFNSKIKKSKLYNLNLYKCEICGLCQLNEAINPKILYDKYLYRSNTSVDLKKHFKEYAYAVSNILKIKKSDLIIDIGSNDGMLLNFFKKYSKKILGIEPAKDIAQIANNKNINTVNAYFNNNVTKKIIKKYRHAKLVTANNVLANVDDLKNWIKNIKLLIGDKGFFVFESFSLRDVLKNKVVDFIYHEHLSIFSAKCIQYLCEKNDLKLFKVERVSTKGGSLRYYISTKKNTISVDQSVSKMIKLEKKENCFNKNTFKKLKNHIIKNKLKLQKIINKNKVIIGVGASISCITLMYQLNIANKINVLIDDNNLKHEKYSPGSNIKIYDPKKFIFNKDQILLILAWRFKKYFLKKYSSKFKGKIYDIWPNIRKI